MCIFSPSKRFKKDIKKAYPDKRRAFKKLQEIFNANYQINKKFHHHKLHGKLKDYYTCYLGPDLVIIYRKDKKNKTIYLLRIGSPSELF